MMEPFKFTADELPHDYHAATSLTWAELEDAGFIDWDDPAWAWDYYDEEQRDRLQKKIAARFEFREIGILPPAVWRRQFIRKLNEIMPKYDKLYEKLSGEFEIFQTGDDYGKRRHVFSDFPATLLNGESEDYASNATDEEHEDISLGDNLDKYVDFAERYNDVDVMILDELEVLFSDLFAVNFNGF